MATGHLFSGIYRDFLRRSHAQPQVFLKIRRPGPDGIIAGVVNDGIAGVPGVLRLTLESPEGKVLASGCLDPGYPIPRRVRQGLMILPPGVPWKGLKLKAELEVKAVCYPVPWACKQKLNSDGSLTLRAREGFGED